METFLLAFIPLFVAIDVFGVLPLFVSLTEGLDERSRKKLVMEATATAFAVSLAFLAGGKLIFSFLGISESDFRVGGGIVLLVLAVSDLLFARVRRASDEQGSGAGPVGVVPIGIPLIMGPAALTTIIILVDSFGYVWTIASLLVNLVIVLVVFHQAGLVSRLMGPGASRAVAKVAALLLVAYAVMMIRSGIFEMLEQ